MRRVGIEPKLAAEQVCKDQTLAADEGFHPLPPPTVPGNYRMALASVVETLNPSVRTLHVIGDTGGIANPVPQQQVVKAMIADAANYAAGHYAAVEFCYHLGDLAYFEGETQAWVQQVYEAYCDYLKVIVGISGNHDAFDYANFVRYMCAEKPELLPEMAEFNRDTVDQPNPYWTLTDPLLTVVGLATNVPSGGIVEPVQVEWLVGELEAAPKGVALIVALHHPPASCDAHHGGSATMAKMLDEAFAGAGRWPDLVLSGHVHNYQRFLRTHFENGAPPATVVPYIVCGAGGYHNLHEMASDATPGMEVAQGVALEAFDATQWGFLRLSITTTEITGEYVGVPREGAPVPSVDAFTVPVG